MHTKTLSLENAQDYAQKPLRNCTFMNSASLLASVIHCHIGIPTKRPGIKFPITKRPVYKTSSLYNVHFKEVKVTKVQFTKIQLQNFHFIDIDKNCWTKCVRNTKFAFLVFIKKQCRFFPVTAIKCSPFLSVKNGSLMQGCGSASL